MKKMLYILVIALLLPAIVSCSAAGTESVASGTTLAASAEQAAEETAAAVFSDTLTQMAVITLGGSGATAEGEGVSIDGSTVTITAEGSYTLSGTLTDGQIVIDAGKDDTVELVLAGVSIASSQSAAIVETQADLLVVTLADGTQNTLSDAAVYVYSNSSTDEPNAALFAKDDLILRGGGSLTVYGNAQNGVATKDDLVIESGTITVTAVNHALRGKDSVTVLGGTLTLTAGDDGIQSDNAEDSGSGTILIEGGAIGITAAHDGMQAETSLSITGGTVGIVSGGGYTTESYSEEESYKGLKSAGSLAVTGGDITVNSLDDAVHGGGSVTVSGGTLTLMSRDDGIHADGTVTIADGVVAIQICYEGIEGTVINLQGGTVSMLCADDGINAADTAQSGQGDQMGGMNDTEGSLEVNISGGTITINAYGDGLDSNGYVTMTGGALYISGPLSSANGAIDYNGTFILSGGVLAAVGSTAMAQTPSQESAQASVIVYFTQTQEAGTTVYLTDADGDVMLSYTPDKEYQCVVFSSPELQTGGSYQVYAGSGGDITSASLVESFSQTGTVTSVGGGSAQTWNPQRNSKPQRNDMGRP